MQHLKHIKDCIKYAKSGIPTKKVFTSVEALEWAVKEIEKGTKDNERVE